MDAQDFAPHALNYIYQRDITITSLSKNYGLFNENTPIFNRGSGFVNTTTLSCRFGEQQVPAFFLTQTLILCFSPSFSITTMMLQESFLQHQHGSFPGTRRIGNSPRLEQTAKAIVEVSNNSVDYTDSFHSFEFRQFLNLDFISQDLKMIL